jgi:RNA polymerase sigma-70 factor (ECF subfamily)
MFSQPSIDDFLERGRAEWPGIQVDAGRFAAHVADLAERRGTPEPEHAADLYLAYACASGAAGACAAFDARHRDGLVRAAARATKSDALAEEAVQVLRVKLFVQDPPKILDYGGRAKLSTWLASAAARTALNLLEAKGAREDEPLDTGRFLARADPELEYVRARYAGELEPALVAALGRLSERDRVVLRLHFVERMTIDALAKVYDVGRSTTARWLAAARETLLDHARRELQERLGLTTSELQSLGGDLASQLQVSLLRLL